MARARYEEKKLDEHRKRAGRTVESPIMLSDEGDGDEDDTTRLSELIILTEAGVQAEEDDDAFFTQAVEAADEAEATYYRRKADHGNVGDPSYSNRVVVEDWYSNDELLTQYVSDLGFLLRRLLVPCFINDQCSYVLEISLCCLVFNLNY